MIRRTRPGRNHNQRSAVPKYPCHFGNGFELRYVFPAEVEHLLVRAGLRLEGRYGSYDLGAFEAGASRMLIVARHETAGSR